MTNINFFKADWVAIILRFYLLMTIVIAAGFTGHWWLALLSLPIFISCLLGVSFSRDKKKAKKVALSAKSSPTRRTAA